MIGLGSLLHPARETCFVRGVAEALPFRVASFERIVCEGSLDHFVDPAAFMAEAASLLEPGGRIVIALANYDSLSCRIGKTGTAATRWWTQRDHRRPYWEPPPDHHHRGDLPFVRRLGGHDLRLERCYGISLLWLLPGWGKALDRLPQSLSNALLQSLDRIAYRAPSTADVIVSIWSRSDAAP